MTNLDFSGPGHVRGEVPLAEVSKLFRFGVAQSNLSHQSGLKSKKEKNGF